jgi:hypothetical protein
VWWITEDNALKEKRRPHPLGRCEEKERASRHFLSPIIGIMDKGVHAPQVTAIALKTIITKLPNLEIFTCARPLNR